MIKYTTDELRAVAQLYNDGFSFDRIVGLLNEDYHDGKPVRTLGSLKYALHLIRYDPRCLDLDE